MNYSIINIPAVPAGRITPEVISRTELMLRLLSVKKRIVEAEIQLAAKMDLTPGRLRHQKKNLRDLFNLSSREPIQSLLGHPQIRQAIEFVFARQGRNDKGSLRSGENLFVRLGPGVDVPVEQYLWILYHYNNVIATECYRMLLNRCIHQMVVDENGLIKSSEDLPSEGTVVRYLRKKLHP